MLPEDDMDSSASPDVSFVPDQSPYGFTAVPLDVIEWLDSLPRIFEVR